MTIWLTRPTAQSDAMARAMELPCIIAPVQHIVHLAPAVVGTFDAVITTSQHACAGVEGFRELPLYTVGEASAEAARQAGFAIAVPLSQDAVGLAAMVVSMHHEPMRFLYLCGAQTRVDIKGLIEAQGHQVTQIVSYEAVAETTLPETLLAQWSQIRGVVLMSIGAVQAVAVLCATHGLDMRGLHGFCISQTVADAARAALTLAEYHVSEASTQQSLIDCVNHSITAA